MNGTGFHAITNNSWASFTISSNSLFSQMQSHCESTLYLVKFGVYVDLQVVYNTTWQCSLTSFWRLLDILTTVRAFCTICTCRSFLKLLNKAILVLDFTEFKKWSQRTNRAAPLPFDQAACNSFLLFSLLIISHLARVLNPATCGQTGSLAGLPETVHITACHTGYAWRNELECYLLPFRGD